MSKICGIYQLRFSSGDIYIGGSVDLNRRKAEHFSRKENVWNQPKLSEAFKRSGLPAFEILVICRKEEKKLYERLAIKNLNSTLNYTATTKHAQTAREKSIESWVSAGERRHQTGERLREVTLHRINDPAYVNPMHAMTKDQLKAHGRKARQTAIFNGTHLNMVKARMCAVIELSEMREFESITAAEKYYKVTGVHAVLTGVQKTTGGRKFAYVKEV